jgi:5-methylcytosine-specific restriction endonuclease McrA
MPGGWGRGSTRAWRKIRAMVLARDHGQCQLRLAGCTVTATCVHHVVGRAVSGDDPRFLLASCQSCNLAIGEPGRRRRTPRRAPRRRAPQPAVYDRWLSSRRK